MDHRPHEPAGQGLHGLVNRPHTTMRAHHPSRTAVLLLRATLACTVAALLVSGVVGGLLRAGVAVPLPGHSAWPGQAVLAHAFLMVCAFMGTLIGVERAVALKHRFAFAAPGASALAGVLVLAGMATAAAWLGVLAAVVFIAVNVIVVSRQRAAHTLLLLAAAVAWLVGNLLHAWTAQPAAVIPWWFSFLVLTIAAERLEMTRLMRRRSGAGLLLAVCLAALLLSSVLSALSPAHGGLLYGLGLTGLAAWLFSFDIARRTVFAHGLSRYMALCLLLGYGWLAIAGAAWMAAAVGHATRDAALHALGLGFVFSMMLGHAPVILPALARVKLLFGWFFYVPLGLLHISLAVRLFFGPFDARLLAAGAAGNAAAIAVFAATMIGAAVAWRVRHPPSTEKRHAVPAPP